MTLRLLDTFSGIGGFSLAARWVGGFQTVQFVEWDPYCQRVLAKNFPDVPIHGDITTFHPTEGAADIICGASHAKTSALPANKQESSRALGLVSFTNSCESFAWFDPNTSSWKTSQRSLLTDWTQFSENWPKQGLMRSGHAYRQVLWEPAISEIGGGLLPTPRAGETADRTSTPGNRFSLSAWASRGCSTLPTPTARDHKDCGANWNFNKAADKVRLAGVINRECQSQIGNALYLNPFFVEEMMGYPIGWTDLKP